MKKLLRWLPKPVAAAAVILALALSGGVAPTAFASQQTIGVGTTANDGTGDPLRTAMQKANANFSELYSTRKYVPGNYYIPYDGVIPTTGTAGGAGTMYCLPFRLVSAATSSELGVRIDTPIASSNIQVAIYGTDAVTGRPTGAPLASTPSFSGGTSVSVTGVLASNVSLAAGIYWDCVNSDTTGVGFATTASTVEMNAIVGSPTLANMVFTTTSGGNGLSMTQAFGTWPTVTPSGFTEGVSAAARAAILIFKVFSAP